jgi:hypothetical protein
MTKDASFKKVVRRHAEESGQRYTEALTDLEGLGARMHAAVNAYRRHIEPTDDELGRLEAVMYIRTLYLACFGYRRALANGSTFNEWGFIEPPEYFSSTVGS